MSLPTPALVMGLNAKSGAMSPTAGIGNCGCEFGAVRGFVDFPDFDRPQQRFQQHTHVRIVFDDKGSETGEASGDHARKSVRPNSRLHGL